MDDPSARRRGLFWFAGGHGIVWLMVLLQRWTVLEPGRVDVGVELLTVAVFVLFYLWATSEGDWVPGGVTSLFGGAGPETAEPPRSQYERQIREVAKQEERNRLARDLHDSVKQQIFVIQTAAATVQARFDADHAGAQKALDQVRASAREAMAEMQAMLDQLRAEPLENATLIEALKKQCEALGFRTGARVEFHLGDLPPSGALPPGTHEAFLRAAQEALSNIGRHARAANVEVWLGSAHGHVELRIKDDGAGFDPNQPGQGQGLPNMRGRAREFGGRFELTSQPGGGTSVAFSIPYAAAGTPAREYLRNAVVAGAGLVFCLALIAWTKRLVNPFLAVFCAIGVIRYLVAYRRAQMRNQDAR
jgi:signal transduction histidine kinase